MAPRRGQSPGLEAVSRVIQRSIETRKPKARYLAAVPLPDWVVLLLRDFIWDTVMRRALKIEPPERKI